MLRIYAFFFSFFVLFCNPLTAATTGQQLANYMGNGSTPRLQLVLSTNGPDWSTFTIDYQQLGNVPWSGDSSNNWSSWNVFDTASPANYYGTITLSSDGTTVIWDSYSAGSSGYYLNGIILSYNSGIGAYQLTIDSVTSPGGGGGSTDGPFPNAPLATPAVYPGTTTPIVLQVQGDQIVTDQGDVVWLKGLVRPSLEWSPTGQYLSTQDLSNIANWKSSGAVARSNVIRLDMYQGYWLESGPVTQSGSYKQIINAIVYYATQLGMAVILDLHWVQAGQQSNMANSDSLTFWQQVAADYKDFGTVLFELYNEPVNISTSVWLNGDVNNDYVGYQQLYDTVRAQGANNLCIIGGLDYAYDLSFVSPTYKVNGVNIVYCSHPYNTKGQAGYTGEGGTFQQNYQGIIGNFPLIFTEFGSNEASYYPDGYASIYTNILNYVNANHVHYTGFAWWVESGQPQFPCLIQDWTGTALYGGINVHNDLLQNPGTLVEGIANVFFSFRSKKREKLSRVDFDGSRFGAGLFCWNFGDASAECTTQATISHNYLRPGVYPVRLTLFRDGQLPFTVSKTIQINASELDPFVVCPARDARVRRVKCHDEVTNIITWKAPECETFCLAPLLYLVFKNENLSDPIARVRNPDKYGIYKVEEKVKRKSKATYTIVAVDQNGNRSLPVTAKSSKKYFPNYILAP